MDIFNLRDTVIGEYGKYIRSFIVIKDKKISEVVEGEIDAGHLWPDPLIQLNPSFESGSTIQQMIEGNELHPECIKIFCEKGIDGSIGKPFNLHQHQIEGIRAANANDSYVVTTGTGSGKSLSYIIPIVNHVLRNGSGKGIQAIIVYPMNALANSQLGELNKFLQLGYSESSIPVTFKRYTGQENEDARKEIIASPPDILLTNYVMLELLLTRPWDYQLIQSTQNLRFLVLDELHTYRGRQGADVSLLVRRLQNSSGSKSIQFVGTSATLAGGSTWEIQQQNVATMATQIFGTKIKPERVIGETLRRVTEIKDLKDQKFISQIQKRLQDSKIDFSGNTEGLLSDPMMIWIESKLGVQKSDGSNRLVRCLPQSISGENGIANELSELTGIELKICEEKIREALLSSNTCRDRNNHPLFAFRLHQFVSKGDSVYASPEAENLRFITLNAQQFVPGSDRSKVLLPLAFCRECGQEYYTVRQCKNKEGQSYYISRSVSDRYDDEEGEAGFLYISENNPWPENFSDQMEKLPDSWLESGGNKIRNSRRNYLPKIKYISADAVDGGGKQIAWWVAAPFKFCLSCGVTYNPNQKSDFGKLTTLGSEGRSTATTIMSLSTIRRLRKDEGIEKQAQKLLSFTDNRQDASLQAGHFNDFVELSLIRSALHRALEDAGTNGIRHDQLTLCVFNSLKLPTDSYAIEPGVRYAAKDDTEHAFREVLGYYLYRDLQQGWRVTSPNLEQCGLLRIEYSSLSEFCAAKNEWFDCHEVLKSADEDERENVCRVLLDFMRRELAVRVNFLDKTNQESIRQLSSQRLKEPWSIDENENLVFSKDAIPLSRKEHGGYQAFNVYISPLGGFGQYLCRPSTFKKWSGYSKNIRLNQKDAAEIIPQLCEKLTIPGIVHRERASDDENSIGAYRINASAMTWLLGSGKINFLDPIRLHQLPTGGRRTNPYFKSFFKKGFEDIRNLEAREHTAQVSNEIRETREEKFRSAELPILYCSPTMELGIDISQLNVVNMRNIPPTPANYAQRSGRAGRSGQPAFIITYCASGSPHDQYFFKRPQEMVSGAVSTPGLDLNNEDLIKSHIHAIWLECSGLFLGSSLVEIIDLSSEGSNLKLKQEVIDKLNSVNIGNKAFMKTKEALGDVISRLLDSSVDSEEWIRSILKRLPESFNRACDRWRGLYLAALNQSNRQQRVIVEPTSTEIQRQSASRLRAEAESQLRLLKDESESLHSDFYSYRYFASEGFLPGYNFPRLPLTAYLPGRFRKKYSNEFLSRPRFLAISEFGPNSRVYHEGSKYEINKVILPVESDGSSASIKQRATQCQSCGYIHPLQDIISPDLCEQCNATLPPAFENLFRMLNVSTRRRERINSDEEERFRLGYDLKTGIRFANRDGIESLKIADVISKDGNKLITLKYGHGASIWRMNLGWHHRRKEGQMGFNLDVERGYWTKNKDELDESDDPHSAKTERVVPFVEDTRNCILLNFESSLNNETMATVEASLKNALQQYFQLEDRELASEALPDSKNRKYILFYEASEGGAGILRQLVEDASIFPKICSKALGLSHFDPNTGQDLFRAVGASEDCESACYDCLLSYYNQRDHKLLDRKLLPELLLSLVNATISASSTSKSRMDQLRRLKNLCQSELEKKWLDLIERLNLNIPKNAQARIKGCGVVADFLYENGVAIFIDGPHHDNHSQVQIDNKQSDLLTNSGLTVIRFHHTEDWESKLRNYPTIFGGITDVE